MPRTYTEKLHPRGHGGKWTKKGLGELADGPDGDSEPGKASAKPKTKAKAMRTKGHTPESSKKFIDDHYGGWRESLSPAQEKGLRFYQSPGFALMNGQLRGLDTDGLKKSERATDADLSRAKTASKNLTAAIKSAPPLKEDVTVFRGFSADQFGKLTEGATVTDKGFTSTSLTDDAGAVGRASSKATAEIKLPAGTKAAAGSSRELVLPPGSKFRITSVTTRGGAPHVTMEYVPPSGGRKAMTAAASTDVGDRMAGLLAELDDDEDRMCELLIQLYWDDFDFDNPTDEELTADAMPVSRMPPQLQKSYIAGKVAQRIRWGVPGDFKRCVAQAKVHGMGRKAEGACAMLHHKALGAWPGREHKK